MRQILLLALILLSCTPPAQEPRKFTLKQGDHYCTPHPIEFINGSSMSFQAKFQDCSYDLGNNNQKDWNKLAGFADNNSLIHDHSARFVWRWDIERSLIEIATYTYNNGTRKDSIIGTTTLSKWDNYEIRSAGTTNIYFFNGNMITIPRSAPLQGLKTKSWPYFGGDEVAPHDMYIYLKEL